MDFSEKIKFDYLMNELKFHEIIMAQKVAFAKHKVLLYSNGYDETVFTNPNLPNIVAGLQRNAKIEAKKKEMQ